MNYWLHRCAHHWGGHSILETEQRLTIGFSDCANDSSMRLAVEKKDGSAFDKFYREIYHGEIWRSRWSLWYFSCEMTAGDIVVVPWDNGFTVCKLKGEPIVSVRKDPVDIGWEWDVEILADACSPRELFASTGLLSRMKCRQTTLCINDLSAEVDLAVSRFRADKPFSLSAELAQKCHELLDKFGSPDHFEQLLKDYFIRLGGRAEILPKNTRDKIGDCDVSAVFPALRLTVSVQAKKHWGETGDWAVRQICDYAKDKDSDDENWSYVYWVVSFANEFSQEAKELAKDNGIVLLNGNDFCAMLVSAGL